MSTLDIICLNCKHFHCYYEPDWSDVTPGSGYTEQCRKGHYDISGHVDDVTTEALRERQNLAKTCHDFVAYTENPNVNL